MVFGWVYLASILVRVRWQRSGQRFLTRRLERTVRQSGTVEWRKWTAEDDEDDDEDGYVSVSCYIFFEEWWSGKPAGISTWIYDKLSQQAYDVLVHYLQ